MFPAGQSSRMLESQSLESVRLARIRWEGASVSQHLQDLFEAWKNLHDNSSEREGTSPWVGIIGKCNFFLSPDTFGSLLVLGVFKPPFIWFSHWLSVPLASTWTARSRIIWQAEVHLCTSLDSGLCEVKAHGPAPACYKEVRIDTAHPSAPHSTSDQSRNANKTMCPAQNMCPTMR